MSSAALRWALTVRAVEFVVRNLPDESLRCVRSGDAFGHTPKLLDATIAILGAATRSGADQRELDGWSRAGHPCPMAVRPTISAIVPVYNSQAVLPKLHQRLGAPYETIFVDDASGDESWMALRDLARSDHGVTAIRLRHNVGQGDATLCGLAHANGRVRVTMDDDLQHRPADPRGRGGTVRQGRRGRGPAMTGVPTLPSGLDEIDGEVGSPPGLERRSSGPGIASGTAPTPRVARGAVRGECTAPAR